MPFITGSMVRVPEKQSVVELLSLICFYMLDFVVELNLLFIVLSLKAREINSFDDFISS